MADIAEPLRAASLRGSSDLSIRIRRGAEYVAIPLFALAVSAALFALFLLVWLPGGPLGSEWPRRSGTPSSLLTHSHSSASVEASHR